MAPINLPEENLKHIKNLLETNQDVKSGRLNKNFQSSEEYGSDIPSISRYFSDGRPMTEKELADLQSQGVKLYKSKDQLMKELKNIRRSGKSTNDSMRQENLRILEEMKTH